MQAFRDKVGNQNATLGQYMNAQRGLTARKGGANDPSVIQRGLKSGQTAYDPSASKPAAPAPNVTTAKTSPADNSGTIATQVAKSVYGSPQSVATSTGMKAADIASGTDMSPKVSAPPTTFQSTTPPSAAPAPMMKTFEPAAPMDSIPNMKAQNSMKQIKEEVQVGTNKYRIV